MAGAGRSKKTNSRLAVRYIDEKVVLSDSHAETWVRIPTVPYEFLDYGSRENIADRITLALAALVTGTESVDVHLRVTTRPFATDFWAQQLDARVQRQKPAPGWSVYLGRMQAHLHEQEFLRKEVYLGVRLGPRTGKGSPAQDKSDFLAPITKLMSRTEKALGFEDDYVSKKELDHWHSKADDVQRSLRDSHIGGIPATPNQVAWLVTKSLHPEMVCPPPTVSDKRVWGPGEIQALGEGVIRNGHRSLAIEQVDEFGNTSTGYTATLCLSRFPDVLSFPDQEPWMHFVASLAFSVDVSSRMTLVPALKVQKDVGRKLLEAKDQAEHISATGIAVPLDVQEQYEVATQVQYTLTKDRMPWSYGRHRLIVTGSTQEELSARCRKVIEHYRDLAIDVTIPSGDQIDLLCESQPGDKVRLRSYEQKQELALISGGMPTASADVGDRIHKTRGWIGPYIGWTTSRVESMVAYSPHVAMTRNSPSGVAITGAPGGGKSFFAFTLAYQMAMQGVWTIYIDPKADAKPMASLPGLGKARLFDLAHGNDGMLDPFSLADGKSEGTLLALETVRLLLGGEMSEDRTEALSLAIERVASEPEPSLLRVVDVLASDTTNTAARNLGHMLRQMADLPFARLCFAAQQGERMRPEDGMTIITLLGLDLPTADTPTKDYSFENRLATSVMYLLTRYARRLMLSLDKEQPKAICIDEAWAITNTPQGKKLIPEVARMGRSHNTALVLVSQNAGDLMAEAVTNSISTVFAFRSTISGEIDNVLSLLNAEVSDPHRTAVRDLENGECLMKDVDGRLARVQISNWNAELFEAFDTNPETRGHGPTQGKQNQPSRQHEENGWG